MEFLELIGAILDRHFRSPSGAPPTLPDWVGRTVPLLILLVSGGYLGLCVGTLALSYSYVPGVSVNGFVFIVASVGTGIGLLLYALGRRWIRRVRHPLSWGQGRLPLRREADDTPPRGDAGR